MENGHDEGCDIPPSRKTFTRCKATLSAFNPFFRISSLPLVIGLFWYVDVLSFSRSHPCISPISDTIVAERRRQNKVEGTTISASTFTAFNKLLHMWRRRDLVMMLMMMTMMIKMKMMIVTTGVGHDCQ